MKENSEYANLQQAAFKKDFDENIKIRDIYEGWSGGLRGEELYKALQKQYNKK